MSLIGQIEHFASSTGDFLSYMERMEHLLRVNVVEESLKLSMFITLAGPEVYSTLKNLIAPRKPDDLCYEDAKAILQQHYSPPKLVIAERFTFHKCHQKESQSIGEYIVEIKSLATSCEFGNFLDDALRDRLVCGLKSEAIQKRLLSEATLSFVKACNIALSFELAENQVKIMQPENINKLFYKKSSYEKQLSQTASRQRSVGKNTSSSQQKWSKCRRCGRVHDEETCPAKEWECFKCKKRGHTSRVCQQKVERSKNIKNVKEELSESEEEVTEEVSQLLINKINKEVHVNKVHEECFVEVIVEGKTVKFEVDTGAGVSIINESLYRNCLNHVKLQKCNVKIKTVTGGLVEVIGKCFVNVEFKNNYFKNLPLIIINCNVNKPLLGRDWLDVLKPRWKNVLLNNICQVDDVNKFKSIYPKVFSNDFSQKVIGYVANVNVKSNAVPVFCRPYTLPYALREPVEKQIEEMVSVGILMPTHYSEWASPVVVVPKKNKSIRICVDFKATVNRYLEKDHYPLPRIDEIFDKVGNGQIFTVLDLSNAYLQLEVNKTSTQYLTINTHKGLYTYTRLPYGIACAPSQFQATMDKILNGINGVACYIDDVIISGNSYDDCMSKVHKVLSKLNHHQVRINVDKCKFFVEKVELLGHELSAGKIKPLKSKMDAIVNAPRPNDLTQLRSYLGLINYYCRFLPMASSILKPLYDLEKNNEKFEWTSERLQAFYDSKNMMKENLCIIPFNPDKEIVIATDASPYGVGAVMSHVINGVEKPVMFASRTLSSAEGNYAQLHREALGVIFAMKKFHKYIFGRSFTLITDHKPLISIFNPEKNIPPLAAARIQRWAHFLSAYNYKINYKPGSKMGNADALSRLPLVNEEAEDVDISFLDFHQIPLTANDVRGCTLNDKTLSKVIEYCKNGWPAKIQDPNVVPYYKRKEDLSLENGILMLGNRTVIPFQLRTKVLELLHEQHIGIIRMKMLARNEVYWPGIDIDIEDYGNSCEACVVHLPKLVQTPLVHWPLTTRNWERIHIDFLEKWNHHILIIVDSHSRWIDLHLMKNGTNATKTIDKLRESFTYFGIPSSIVSDNGPPFNGEIYKKFCLANNIKCILTPPLHPCSNGTVEKQVNTVKQNLIKQVFDISKNKKVFDIKHALQNFLFKYRNTPNTVTGFTPAEVMFKQQPRTPIKFLKPKEIEGQRETKIRKKVKEKVDEHRGKVRKFHEGDKVWVYELKKNNGQNWSKGKIEKSISPVTYLVTVGDRVRFLHEDYLKHSPLTVRSPYKEELKETKEPAAKQEFHDGGVTSNDVTADSRQSLSNSPKSLNTPSGTPVLRRTTRIIRKPQRLDL